MKQAGILIVTYNSEAHIEACIQSAVECSEAVVVVDNASQDGTKEIVTRQPSVTLINNNRNRGFAGAVNQGVAALNCEFVLLLNPDAVLRTDIAGLVEACSQTGVAAAGGKLIDANGEPQRGFTVRRFPTPVTLAFEVMGWNRLWQSNPVNQRYRCYDLDLDKSAEVEQPSGACLMLRQDAWRLLGGMDEEFHPIWFDEVDFLKRAHNHGLAIRYTPAVVAEHKGGHSVRELSFTCRQLYWYGSLLRYASKHFGHAGRVLVCVAVMLGSLLRMLGGIIIERNPKAVIVYGRVIRIAGKHLLRGRIRSTGGYADSGTIS